MPTFRPHRMKQRRKLLDGNAPNAGKRLRTRWAVLEQTPDIYRRAPRHAIHAALCEALEAITDARRIVADPVALAALEAEERKVIKARAFRPLRAMARDCLEHHRYRAAATLSGAFDGGNPPLDPARRAAWLNPKETKFDHSKSDRCSDMEHAA